MGSTSKTHLPRAERTERRWQFDHRRLDAYAVALDAMVLGDAVAEELLAATAS